MGRIDGSSHILSMALVLGAKLLSQYLWFPASGATERICPVNPGGASCTYLEASESLHPCLAIDWLHPSLNPQRPCMC